MTKARKAVRFRMTFPAKVVGMPLIHTLSHDYNVVPNIMLGRVTEKGAWLDVEIVGLPKDVEKAVDYLESSGVKLDPI